MLFKIKDAAAEIERLTSELEAAKETARAKSEALMAVMGERDTIKDTAAVVSTALVEATHRIAALEASKLSVADKAAEVVAQAGFTAPVPVAEDATEDFAAQLAAMPYGAARQQFFLKHRTHFSK